MAAIDRHSERRIWTSLVAALVVLFGAMVALRASSAPMAPASWVSACGLAGMLIVLSAIDIRTQRLPDVLTVPLALAGLGLSSFSGLDALLWSTAGACAGFVFFRLVGEAYKTLRGRDGLGGGDAKLLGAGGAWVGLDAVLTVVLLASASAVILLLAMRLLGRLENPNRRIPYGPFLAVGIWYAWLFGPVHWS